MDKTAENSDRGYRVTWIEPCPEWPEGTWRAFRLGHSPVHATTRQGAVDYLRLRSEAVPPRYVFEGQRVLVPAPWSGPGDYQRGTVRVAAGDAARVEVRGQPQRWYSLAGLLVFQDGP